jgi:putative hemolysin
MSRLLALALAATIALLATGCAPLPALPETPASPASAAIANPASVHCVEQGYRLEIRTDAAGGQYGVCLFPDGTECEEWAYFRGECAPGGEAAPTPAASDAAPLPALPETPASPASAAAIANPASGHCVQKGYRLEMRTDAAGGQSGVCVFPDGTECDEWAYFRGACAPGGEAALTPAASGSAPLPTAPPATATDPGAASPETTAGGALTYTSPALGISFDYLPQQNGQAIRVTELGDKIFVHPDGMAPEAGQWVQVFSKPAGESLEDAIRRAILPGHPEADCRVVPKEPPAGAGPDGSYAGIAVRRAPGEAEETVLARWRTCPQPYTVVGGIGYFQAGAARPDRFLFFSIGQYGIMAAEGTSWQETVRFE